MSISSKGQLEKKTSRGTLDSHTLVEKLFLRALKMLVIVCKTKYDKCVTHQQYS